MGSDSRRYNRAVNLYQSLPDCLRKMNQLLLSLSAFLVASVTVLSANALEIKGDAKAGEKKNAMCIGCHGIVGYQASFPEIHKVPKISGQGEKYIIPHSTPTKKASASTQPCAVSLFHFLIKTWLIWQFSTRPVALMPTPSP